MNDHKRDFIKVKFRALVFNSRSGFPYFLSRLYSPFRFFGFCVPSSLEVDLSWLHCRGWKEVSTQRYGISTKGRCSPFFRDVPFAPTTYQLLTPFCPPPLWRLRNLVAIVSQRAWSRPIVLNCCQKLTNGAVLRISFASDLLSTVQ